MPVDGLGDETTCIMCHAQHPRPSPDNHTVYCRCNRPPEDTNTREPRHAFHHYNLKITNSSSVPFLAKIKSWNTCTLQKSQYPPLKMSYFQFLTTGADDPTL